MKTSSNITALLSMITLCLHAVPIGLYADNHHNDQIAAANAPLALNSANMTQSMPCSTEPAAPSPTHYVSTNGASIWPYTNWTTAASTIQAAIHAATDGDTVLVDNGIYAAGGTEIDSLSNRVALTKPITVQSLHGKDNTFIIGAGPCGASAVRCAYVTNGAELIGFTLTGGHTVSGGHTLTDTSAEYTSRSLAGGGVFLDYGGTVSSCTINSNSSETYSGGAHCYYGGTLSNCTIRSNFAMYDGGGASCYYGGTLNKCIISSNAVDDFVSGGGGVFCNNSGTLNGCTIRDNIAVYGGGVYCDEGGTLNNCIISSNYAYDYGGGVKSSNGGTLHNCTISSNSARKDAGGASCYSSNTLSNCILWGNTADENPNWHCYGDAVTFAHCCTTPAVGNNCVTNDPLFVATGNYHLLPDSPCIDTGNNAYATWSTDLDGNPRLAGTTVDIGAYEFVHVEHIGDSPIHYVSPSGASIWPYSTWATAANTIQLAVNAAVAGNTVLVNYGRYQPGTQITVDKAITLTSAYGADFTIVDGQNTHRCFNLGNTACTLSGFTLTAGLATGSFPANNGGGVYCSDTTPIITHCTLSNNSADEDGGGSHKGTLTDCTLSGNSADSDGGGSYYGTLNHCTLSGNSASRKGGGSSESTLNHCTLSGNYAYIWGGGSYRGTLNHCTLVGNSAGNQGGGNYKSTLNHCTLVGNSAGTDGGGSYDCKLNHCILWNNNTTTGSGDNWYAGWSDFFYCCTTPLPKGTGNIDVDPKLSESLHLRFGSPCIDAGISQSGMVDDLDGTPRPLDGDGNGSALPDMGAYEFYNFSADSDADGLTDGHELVVLGTSPITPHSDGDPASDYQEFISDTDPLDGSDWFRITAMDLTPPVTLRFPTSASRQYSLQTCTNLAEGGWINVPTQTGIMGSGGEDFLADPSATNLAAFYRVEVRIP
ncbi:choice-of-anchor Q domain-containing protein [Pontiellaceae bacterium B12227]|nr:choice-of-anchor Q domain-containing protein [Pontiellaceae bacterium B12227]